MGGLKRFLAVVLALVFLILLPTALLLLAVQGLLLTPAFYKQQLVKSGVYSRVYAEIVPALADSIEAPKELPLTKEDIGGLIRRLLPESFIMVQTEKAIDEFFAVLLSEKETFEIVVPLREIKQRIPDEVVDVLENKLAAMPSCSETELSAQLLSEGLPTCLPPGVDVEGIKPQYRAQAMAELRRMSDALPDSIDLTKELAEESGGVEQLRSSLEAPRRILSDFARWALFLYAFLAVVLILIGVLGGDSFNSGVGWIGVTLLVGGIGVLLITLLVPPMATEAITRFGHDSKTPKEIMAIVSPLITSIISDLTLRLQMEAGGVTVSGVVLFFISRVI